MRRLILKAISMIAAIALSGCASNPNAVGQVLPGILSGIGTGLSSL